MISLDAQVRLWSLILRDRHNGKIHMVWIGKDEHGLMMALSKTAKQAYCWRGLRGAVKALRRGDTWDCCNRHRWFLTGKAPKLQWMST